VLFSSTSVVGGGVDVGVDVGVVLMLNGTQTGWGGDGEGVRRGERYTGRMEEESQEVGGCGWGGKKGEI